MPLSDNWLRFRKAEDEFFTCRYNLMQNKDTLASDLKIALEKARDRETALGLLVETKPGVAIVRPLLPTILDTAIDSSNLNAIGLARKVLCDYGADPQVRIVIQATAATYLVSNDEWHYRRIAELYNLLDYKAELTDLIALCQVNTNPEIQELGEEFTSEQ